MPESLMTNEDKEKTSDWLQTFRDSHEVKANQEGEGSPGTMTVRRMGEILGLGKTDSYWLVKKNYFRTTRVRGRMRVDIREFETWYANQVRYHKVSGEEPGKELKASSMSVGEFEKKLGLCRDYGYEVMEAEGIPYFIVGGWKRIRKQDFERWYRRQERYLTIEDRKKYADLFEKTISMPEMAWLLGVTRHDAYSIIRKKTEDGIFKNLRLAGHRRIYLNGFEEWYSTQDEFTKRDDWKAELLKRRMQKKVSQKQDISAEKKALQKLEQQKKAEQEAARDRKDDWMTVDQAAEMAGVSRKAVREWIKGNKFSFIRLPGNGLRIHREEFQRWIKSMEWDRN
ncbi:MAG: helix-turn-helix domain-containing protein [Bilifractor sp.]